MRLKKKDVSQAWLRAKSDGDFPFMAFEDGIAFGRKNPDWHDAVDDPPKKDAYYLVVVRHPKGWRGWSIAWWCPGNPDGWDSDHDPGSVLAWAELPELPEFEEERAERSSESDDLGEYTLMAIWPGPYDTTVRLYDPKTCFFAVERGKDSKEALLKAKANLDSVRKRIEEEAAERAAEAKLDERIRKIAREEIRREVTGREPRVVRLEIADDTEDNG